MLRAKEGSLIEIIERASGKTYEAVIQEVSKEVKVKIIRLKPGAFPHSRIDYLIFALCKGDTNDWVLEKCCELAVANVILWQASHSVVKLKSEDDVQKKLVRWQKICDAGSKQSGNPKTTLAHYAPNLESALKLTGKPDDLTILYGAISDKALSLKELSPNLKRAAFIIGPEGDFSNAELESLRELRATGISLGPYVLRAETAALSAVSSFNALFGYIN